MQGMAKDYPAPIETTTKPSTGNAGRQFVTFFVGRHFFGLPIEDVIEINRSLDITPVPLAPPYVAGVINLRGHILTSIHLARRLGIPETELEENGTLHNVVVGSREEPVSLIVESIGDVCTVPWEQIAPPPERIEGIERRFVKNVCKLPGRLLVILDTKDFEEPDDMDTRRGLSGP